MYILHLQFASVYFFIFSFSNCLFLFHGLIILTVIYLFDILLRVAENRNDTSQMGSGKLVSKW